MLPRTHPHRCDLVRLPLALAGLACATLAPCALAQWTAVVLHPPGASSSFTTGVSGGRQVGYYDFEGVRHACSWTGSAASLLDLNPIGASQSLCTGTNGSVQIGTATIAGTDYAGIWAGSSATWVALPPPPAPFGANPTGIGGTQIVGVSSSRAILWNTPASSPVSLHPFGALQSWVYGVDGGQQVGQVDSTATLWTGTPESAISLTAPFGVGSTAVGIHNGQQVGTAMLTGASHACVWRGTSASCIDLNPAWSQSSAATAVYEGQQVGYARFGGQQHAGLWQGTAESWINLHQTLPPGFSLSYATGVWSDSNATYVVGVGTRTATSQNQALLWIGPPPPVQACGPADVGSAGGMPGPDGFLDNNDFIAFIEQFFAGC